MEEIPCEFSDGADFLIAHQVLEHCANPIAVLIEWNAHLANGGIGIVSVPHYEHCTNERSRIVPPFEHLLLDYSLSRDGRDYESREHILSGYLAWEAELPQMESQGVFAQTALDVHREVDEHHWHALDDALFLRLLFASGVLGDRRIRLLKYGTASGVVKDLPIHTEWFKTNGEMIAIYRVLSMDAQPRDESAVLAEIGLAREKLLAAADLLDPSSVQHKHTEVYDY